MLRLLKKTEKLKMNICNMLIIIIIFCLIGGCSKKENNPEKFSGKRESITIGLAKEALASLVMIAEEKGFFSENGLDVTINEFHGGKQALINGLFEGKVDMATVADVPIVFNSFKRNDYSIVATIGTSDNELKIVARKDKGIHKPGDLKGRHIGVKSSSSVHFFLHLFLLYNGISENEVQISLKPGNELVKDLLNGDIDAISTREPFISEIKGLSDKVVVFKKPGIYRKTINFVAFNDFAIQKPKVIEKTLNALLKAEEFVENHPLQSIKIVSHVLKTPESDIAAIWPDLELRVSLDQSLLLGLEDSAGWFMENDKSIYETIPNYLNYIHLDGLDTLKPGAITIIR